MLSKPSDNTKPKQKHKKGLWSPDEDQKLRNYIMKHGHSCWSSVPINAGLQRNGKSCRLRWINYLRPGLKREAFTVREEEVIIALHRMLGNKWSQIAQHLPGRTDNEVKNHWHSYLKKRHVSKTIVETESMVNGPSQVLEPSPSSTKSTARNFESFESTHIPSLTDMSSNHHQSIQKTENPNELQRSSNLPKVLFAEWLSSDHFLGESSGNNFSSIVDLKSNLDTTFMHNIDSNSNTMFEDSSVHNNPNQQQNQNSITIEDMMIQSPFKFEDQIPPDDYFPGEFAMNVSDHGIFYTKDDY